jgi:hypothetical protein
MGAARLESTRGGADLDQQMIAACVPAADAHYHVPQSGQPATSSAGKVPEPCIAKVAMQSAGITLVKGDLRGIAKAIRLSRTTMWNIRQNLFFAFIYNTLGIPVAAGLLYPMFGVLLSPIIAGAAMSLSSVSVIANALRLRNMRL